ncbi:MAG TPA: glycosyltransferase family 2 protein [Polyangiaceae bacterium]|nr:glycosyltransferase family 2 protein [Polyangiaceae bacterium]
MKVLAVVPAFQAEKSVAAVVSGLLRELSGDAEPRVLVVDDGSTDRTAAEAERAGAVLLRHPKNLGKGAALRAGLRFAHEAGFGAIVSVDADGQHPPDEAARVAQSDAPRDALVLGVRDLVRDGAPRANRFSNEFSNVFLSWFGGVRIHDSQCGLRRYPVPETLALDARSDGYAFEAEALLRAARLGWRIVELPVRVIYPPPAERVSHFHSVRDPARIVARVLETTFRVPRQRS